MSGIEDWLDLMTDSVVVEPFVSRTTHGVPTYGAARDPYAARVNYQVHYVRNADGEQVVARGYAIIATTDTITVKDRITLADGTQPLILIANLETDEAGPLYTRIDFA